MAFKGQVFFRGGEIPVKDVVLRLRIACHELAVDRGLKLQGVRPPDKFSVVGFVNDRDCAQAIGVDLQGA